MADLTNVQRDILFILGGGDTYSGVEIREELQDYYQDQIKKGRLYTNLDGLCEDEYVEKIDDDAIRENEYKITEKGKHWVKMKFEWHEDQREKVETCLY